jgi:hypothetical protein
MVITVLYSLQALSTKYSLRPTNKNTSSTWAPRSMKLINYTATPIKVADSTENYSKMNKPTTVV